jgi:hypothetical protein
MANSYDNSGIIKNNTKTKQSHPDYKGGCTIAGKEFWVSAWNKGEGRISLSFTPKDENYQRKPGPAKIESQDMPEEHHAARARQVAPPCTDPALAGSPIDENCPF